MKSILVSMALTCLMLAQTPDTRGKVFVAISRVEGCVKWNNPGCLKYAAQAGATPGPGGYAVFETAEQGKSALRGRIATGAGKTVRQFLTEYNPGVPTYVDRVASLAKLDLGAIL